MKYDKSQESIDSQQKNFKLKPNFFVTHNETMLWRLK